MFHLKREWFFYLKKYSYGLHGAVSHNNMTSTSQKPWKYKIGKGIANQAILAHKYCRTQTFPHGDPLRTFLLDIAGKRLFLFKKIHHKA